MREVLNHLWSRVLKPSAPAKSAPPEAPSNPESLTAQLRYASASEISQTVAQSIHQVPSEDESPWLYRAVGLVNHLAPPLVHLRDHQGQALGIHELRERLSLSEIETLCWSDTGGDPELERILTPIRQYLLNLPKYDKRLYDQGLEQESDTQTYHGFICMHLTPIFEHEMDRQYPSAIQSAENPPAP